MTSFGSLYRRGTIWWIQHCHRGQTYRESSRSEVKDDAKKLLRARLAEIAQIGHIAPSLTELDTVQMSRPL